MAAVLATLLGQAGADKVTLGNGLILGAVVWLGVLLIQGAVLGSMGR